MKRILYIIHPLFFVFYFFSNVYPQDQIFFERISTEIGLSSQQVNQIIQDDVGILWFATQNGLNKFDGYSVSAFKNDPIDSTTLSYNNVSSICELKGELWIGTFGGGLSRFNKAYSFRSYLHSPNDSTSIAHDFIYKLFVDSDSTLWLLTENGLSSYNSKKDSFTSYLVGNKLIWITEDFDGNLYISATDALYIFNKESKQSIKIPMDYNKDIISNRPIVIEKNSIIWIGTDKGLRQFNKEKNEIIELDNTKYHLNGIDKLPITTIHKDTFGTIWVGTFRGGLFRLEKGSNEFKVTKHNQYDVRTVGHNSIRNIFEDRSQNLWVSTPAFGISKHNLKPQKFELYYHIPNDKNILSNNVVLSFFEDPLSRLWIGTDYDIAIVDKNNKTNKIIQLPAKKTTKNFVSVLAFCKVNDSQIWIGTRSEGLFIYDYKKENFIDYSDNKNFPKSLNDVWIRRIFKDQDGDIWITSDKNLFRYIPAQDTFVTYNRKNSRISDEFTISIYQDLDGFLWIGTRTGGVCRLDKKTNEFQSFQYSEGNKNSLSSNYVVSLNGDDENIWVGTINGLNKINRKTLQIEQITSKEGLVDDCINGILIDDEGNIWMSTNYGISQFIIEENRFRNFDKYDGLQDYKYKGLSSYKSKTGKMYFGGQKGYNVFNPSKVEDNKFIPPIVITSFKVRGKEKLFDKDVTLIKEIELEYAEHDFEFEFAALDYTAPSKNLFQYKLEGFDKEWSEISTKRFANYTNLDGGKYVFKVKGSNNDNYWNQEETRVFITIIPPLYKTFVFQIVSIILIIIIIMLFINLRIQRIEKSRTELERLNKRLSEEITERKQTELELISAKETAEQADSLKSEFLAQISHEIRSPINVISNYASLIKEEITDKGNEIISNSFRAIDVANKRIIRTIDLIINMSEIQLGIYHPQTNKLNLEKYVMDDIKLQYINSAQKKNIKLLFESDNTNPTILGDRYSVTQIFANLIDNAIKYTEKGEITVNIKSDSENRIVVTVEDTGIGISKKYLPSLFDSFTQEDRGYTRKFDGNGLGLALVKKYCDLNNANIDVESEKGIGTKFTVVFNTVPQ